MTNGLVAILPLIAVDLGMSKSLTGIYLSSSYVMLLSGNFLMGYLIDKIKNVKALLITTTFMFTLSVTLHSFVHQQWQLFASTALLWFTMGGQSVILNTVQGRHTDIQNSGKNYAKLSIASVTGAIIGGLLIGFLLKLFKVNTMFRLLGLTSLIAVISSILSNEKYEFKREKKSFVRFNRKLCKNKRLLFFYISAILISIVNYILLLSLSIMMKEKRYQYFVVAMIVAIGAILSIPVIYFFGKLSDIKGRKFFLLTTYALFILGFIALFNPLGIIFFILASISRASAVYTKNSLSLAHIKEIASKRNLGKAISYFSSTTWAGGIIGFSIGGLMIDNIGYHNTFYISTSLALLAIILFILSFNFKMNKI